MKKITRWSIFTRLALAGLSILLVFYCISAGLLIRNTISTRNEFLDSRHRQAKAYVENMERQLNAIYAQESYLVNNQDVKKLAYALYGNNYEKYQMVLSLFRTMDYIKSLSPMIEDIAVRLPPQSITVSSRSGYSYGLADEATEFNARASASRLMVEDGGIVMRILYPLMYSLANEYTPDMVITISLDRAALQETLSIFTDDSGSCAALVFNDDLVIDSAGSTFVSDHIGQFAGNTEDHTAAISELFRTDIIAASAYPLKAVICISNEALAKITAQYIILLSIVSLLTSGIFLVFVYYTRKLIHKPLGEIIGAFDQLREGRFDVRLHHKPHDEFGYIYSEFNETVEKLEQLIHTVLEQDKLINAAELTQLQSQINPHFLYNSFFIIGQMAKNEEYEQINAFVTSLARYYRFLNKAQQDVIPLRSEIEHMNNYIDIQQMRFGDKISIEQDAVPPGIGDRLVPKLILQPIIENAYKYGMADMLENGLIRISYQTDGDTIYIIIEDNGQCPTEIIEETRKCLEKIEDEQKSHALYNTNRRLKLFFGEESGITVERSELGGFKVSLFIPEEQGTSIIGH